MKTKKQRENDADRALQHAAIDVGIVIDGGTSREILDAKKRLREAALRYARAVFALALLACSGDTFRSLPLPPMSIVPDLDAGAPEPDVESGARPIEDGAPSFDSSSSDSASDSGPLCPDKNDVAYGGRCFYLDGSKGVCDSGYELGANADLAAILGKDANAWQGKDYRHAVSDNACVLTKDVVENYGMTWHANLAGPFSAGEPVLNGGSCWMVSNMQPKQLTLCRSK